MSEAEQIRKRLRAARDDAETLTDELDCILVLAVQDAKPRDTIKGVSPYNEVYRAMLSVLEDSSIVKNENERLQAIVDKLPKNSSGDPVSLGSIQELICGGEDYYGTVTLLMRERCFLEGPHGGYVDYDQLRTPRQMAEETDHE